MEEWHVNLVAYSRLQILQGLVLLLRILVGYRNLLYYCIKSD